MQSQGLRPPMLWTRIGTNYRQRGHTLSAVSPRKHRRPHAHWKIISHISLQMRVLWGGTNAIRLSRQRHLTVQRLNQVRQHFLQLAGGNSRVGVKTAVVLAIFCTTFKHHIQKTDFLELQVVG